MMTEVCVELVAHIARFLVYLIFIFLVQALAEVVRANETICLVEASRQQLQHQKQLCLPRRVVWLVARGITRSSESTVERCNQQLPENIYIVGKVPCHQIEETLVSRDSIKISLRKKNALKSRHDLLSVCRLKRALGQSSRAFHYRRHSI